MLNNTTYGMTGGQHGPTTMMGQITTTSPMGRNREYYGYPAKMAEQLALCDGCAYSARVALDSIPHINEAKKGGVISPKSAIIAPFIPLK